MKAHTIVEFHDPNIVYDWHPVTNELFQPPEPCVVVGFVIFEDNDWLSLCFMVGSEVVNTRLTIRKACIVSRRDYN